LRYGKSPPHVSLLLNVQYCVHKSPRPHPQPMSLRSIFTLRTWRSNNLYKSSHTLRRRQLSAITVKTNRLNPHKFVDDSLLQPYTTQTQSVAECRVSYATAGVYKVTTRL